MMDISFLTHLLFWLIIPTAITNVILKIFHSIFYSSIKSVSPSTRQLHYKVVYSLVVISYLGYSLIEIEGKMHHSFYSILNVNPQTLDTRELKSNYRRLSLMYHPDKMSAMMEDIPIQNPDEIYLKVRKAYEVLKEPLTKISYDKFGDVILSCTHCKTARDYLMTNIWGSLTFYAVSFTLIITAGFLGRMDYGQYWRYVILCGIAALEFSLLFQEQDIIPFFIPWRPRFQRITILHQFYMVLFIAVSQIGPIMFPQQEQEIRERLKSHVNELEKLTELLWNDSFSLYSDLMKPFKSDADSVKLLQQRMNRIAVEFQLYETYTELNDKYREVVDKQNNKKNN